MNERLDVVDDRQTRAFRLGKELLKPEQLTRCDRSLLDALRRLTMEDLTKTMGNIMRKDEMDGSRRC